MRFVRCPRARGHKPPTLVVVVLVPVVPRASGVGPYPARTLVSSPAAPLPEFLCFPRAAALPPLRLAPAPCSAASWRQGAKKDRGCAQARGAEEGGRR
jgi:hypothetical protein